MKNHKLELPSKPEYKSIQYTRHELYEDLINFLDLVGKQCRVVQIEKRLSGNAFFLYLYFIIENEKDFYLIGIPPGDSYTDDHLTENQKLLLKSTMFTFEIKNDLVVIIPEKEASQKEKSSMKVWHLDPMRGCVGVYEYLEL